MIYRREAGDRGMAPCPVRRGLLALAAGAVATAVLPWPEAGARAAGRPLDHLAAVVNGRVVGSAFLLAPDVAVTNAHVVAGVRRGASVTLIAGPGRRAARARLLAISRRMDLAVLAAPPGLLQPVPRQDAPRRPGLAVRAAGVDARFGLGPSLELSGAVAAVDSHLPRYGPGSIVRLPGVRLGFSGGPVLDARGHLVGMVTAIRAATGASATASGRTAFAPLRAAVATEAFVLGAADLRREAARLVATAS